MRYIGNKKVIGMYLGSKPIAKRYLGSKLIWQKISYTTMFGNSAYITSYFGNSMYANVWDVRNFTYNNNYQDTIAIEVNDSVYEVSNVSFTLNPYSNSYIQITFKDEKTCEAFQIMNPTNRTIDIAFMRKGA